MFDDLVGYAFYHKTEVKAAIGDKVKCIDGEVVEFFEGVEYLPDEFDDIVILQKKDSVSELERFKKYLISKDANHLIESVDKKIKIAEADGYYFSYVAIFNDDVKDVFSFSL